MSKQLPIPQHFVPQKGSETRVLDYDALHDAGLGWAKSHDITPSHQDDFKRCLLLIDMQRCFCAPGHTLYVGGRSGTGGVDDTNNTASFIYRELQQLTSIVATMDTHRAWQISHRLFWVDKHGDHPAPNSILSNDDIQNGVWAPNPAAVRNIRAARGSYAWLCAFAKHYSNELTRNGQWPLAVWGYHAMLGGNDHALMDPIQEALFFHNVARKEQNAYETKGGNQITENYSVFSPEVTSDHNGEPIPGAQAENFDLFSRIDSFDEVYLTGEAKSHCVLWTGKHLVAQIRKRVLGSGGTDADARAALKKLFFIKDLTTAVVIPAYDFTDAAEQAYADLEAEGVNVVSWKDSLR